MKQLLILFVLVLMGNARASQVISFDTGQGLNSESVVVTLVDGANVSLDPSQGDIFTLTATGNRTILAPASCVSGKRITIRHTASGGARTLTLTTGSAGAFRFGTDISALSATDSGKTDYISAICNGADNRFDVIAVTKGY